MPPKSRGLTVPSGFQSKSTPNLHTLPALEAAFGEEPLPCTKPPPIIKSDQVPHDEQSANSSEEASSSSHSHSDNDDAPAPRRPLYTSRSQTSLGLFPPFYNRPPTPLPPSPSLTSLLRPTFSTTTSRPSTASSSDAEPLTRHTTTNTPNAPLPTLTATARHAPTIPRASPKVPTYEYYGFAVYLGSSAAFLMYVLWAYVPSPLLHQMGIHYYPNRWWALAVPAWLVVLVVWIFVALASYNTGYLTLPMGSVENLVDRCGKVATVGVMAEVRAREKGKGEDKEKKGKTEREGHGDMDGDEDERWLVSSNEHGDWKSLWSVGTDAVLDVPIGGVCEILYGSEREVNDAHSDVLA